MSDRLFYPSENLRFIANMFMCGGGGFIVPIRILRIPIFYELHGLYMLYPKSDIGRRFIVLVILSLFSNHNSDRLFDLT